jgi:hypothetical protein
MYINPRLLRSFFRPQLSTERCLCSFLSSGEVGEAALPRSMLRFPILPAADTAEPRLEGRE